MRADELGELLGVEEWTDGGHGELSDLAEVAMEEYDAGWRAAVRAEIGGKTLIEAPLDMLIAVGAEGSPYETPVEEGAEGISGELAEAISRVDSGLLYGVLSFFCFSLLFCLDECKQ